LPAEDLGSTNLSFIPRKSPVQQLPEFQEQRALSAWRELDSLIERELQEAMGDSRATDVMVWLSISAAAKAYCQKPWCVEESP